MAPVPGKSTVTATVLWGANNIYSLRADDGRVFEHVRLKGKTLPGTEEEHNPLAPGDVVELDETGGTARILRRVERRNTVLRWNRTRHRMQAIAANADRLCIVASAGTPVYRAAFVDRVLVMAELEEIPAMIVVNKSDLALSDDATEHLEVLQSVGYAVVATAATVDDDTGVATLTRMLSGQVSVFFGQSGVGKSSLINALVPGLDLATGDVSRRYRRGRHTTTLARQVLVHGERGDTVYIDTPGVREYDLFGYGVTEVAAGFREFRAELSDCAMPGCTHVHEPRCAVRAAVAAGRIHQRRYEAYCRVAQTLQGAGS